MKRLFNFYFAKEYTNFEWICIKVLLLGFWLKTIFKLSGNFDSVPIPAGICKIIPCDFLTNSWVSMLFIGLSCVFSILYLFEKKMMLTTFILFLISLFFFTLEESNGVLERRGLLTFLFLSQFLAYLFHHYQQQDFNLKKYRIQFSIQVIAVGYFLSASSKLYTSGLNWIVDGVRMPLQILKSFHSNYADFGDSSFLHSGNEIVQFMESNPLLIYITLTVTLILELGAISVLFYSRRYTVMYGLLLFCMHQGIYVVMNIRITSIYYPMVILFINPLFLVSIILSLLYQRFALKRRGDEIRNLN